MSMQDGVDPSTSQAASFGEYARMGGLQQYKWFVRGLKLLLLRILRFLRCNSEASESTSFIDIWRILVCHLYLTYGRKPRIPAYDYEKKDLFNRGLLFRDEEKKLEYPVPQQILNCEGPQELLFTSVRTSGELLVVRFARAERRQAEINILIRDSKGRTFITPNTGGKYLLLDISHDNKFQAGGLRMQCLEPMRKWRVAFNGLLINKETGATAYVRFAFLWFAVSPVSDWACDVPAKRLFKFCLDPKAERKISETIANLEVCREYLNGYEETGYCVGSLQVSPKDNPSDAEEAEQELHMRGDFLRIRHPDVSSTNSPKLTGFTHSFTYTRKGHLLQLSTLKFGNGKELIFGSFLSTPGFKDPIESIVNDRGDEASLEDVLYAPNLKISTFELSHELLRSEGSLLVGYKSHLGWENEINIYTFDALIDNIAATGLSIQGVITGDCNDDLLKPPVNILDFDPVPVPAPFVVSLDDSHCKSTDLTGGKGSSLAVLAELSGLGDDGNSFSVPRGVVVTTEAFRRFMQSPAMFSTKNNLTKVLEAKTVEDVKEICDRCMNDVKAERLPTAVSKDILQHLYAIFPDLAAKRFAVRSSCAGEDSEDMSAAGQMETFLGVKGEQQILEAVLKCWASQFSHVAIEYKKRYGQELVSDMAVVIMEMVPADSAGVMFTCDPLTGDPSTIYITSNFGLGESVVSAMADPDTVRVSRDISGKLSLKEVAVGKKDVKIVMDADSGGTRVENVTDNDTSSLSPAQAELLANIGAKIERCYGDWRDVEWAFAQDTLYVLQARPVTFMEKPSDLEIATSFEVPSKAESSVYSKANVGEVLNGAVTPLSLVLMNRTIAIEIKREKGDYPRLRRCALSPYYDNGLRLARYTYFFDMSEALRLFAPDPSSKPQIDSMMLNMCGRIIDDDELYEDMGDKTDKDPDIPFFTMHKDLFEMKYLAKPISQIYRYLAHRATRLPEANMTVDELFNGLCDASNNVTDYGAYPHFVSSNGSSQWTSRIVEYLQDVTDESLETIYGDMSRLLASADDVVSCEVPNKLEKLGVMIGSEIGRERFIESSAEEAEKLLKEDEKYPICAAEFRQCLKEFGHRGYNEFDVYRKTWDMDASPVIATLQTMMRSQMDGTPKKYESILTSIQGMKIKLTPWQKLRLAAIVFFARRAVGVRENTKSLWIWTQNIVRKWSWALARKMKQEGRLPDEELLFFCTPAEIHELIRNRNPAIISRAFDRKRLFPEMVNQEFREYFRGIARPAPEPLPVFEDGVVQMKGFPISKGRIQAKARVINRLQDAVQIQKGEILITYATDIGWSPYFPMLGGVVTELGGLMSHGAVVAREYGLPCVVGLLGATKVFRSGDTVLLDGAQGMLIRIEEAA